MARRQAAAGGPGLELEEEVVKWLCHRCLPISLNSCFDILYSYSYLNTRGILITTIFISIRYFYPHLLFNSPPPLQAAVPALTLDEAKALMARLQSAFGPSGGGGVGVEGEGEGGEVAAVDSLECSICLDPLTIEGTKLIRKCSHFFCGQCLDTLLAGQSSGSCPMCRATFRMSDLVESGEVMKYIDSSKEQEEEGGVGAASSSASSSSSSSSSGD